MTAHDDAPPVSIDAMALAYEAFQGCRGFLPGTEVLLAIADQILPLVARTATTIVAVPPTWLGALPPDVVDVLARAVENVRAPAVTAPQVLRTIAIAIRELLRLWSAGERGAIRSLGYALHPLPSLVRAGEQFDPKYFGFNLRVAAFHWAAYSAEAQHALAALAGVDPGQVAERLARPGFVVEMFREAPAREER